MISVIIPTYNRVQLIGQTLDSILAQTYENWECIVVDDGSTDHTDELLGFYIEKDARIRYYHRPENRPKGANACRNYGFEVSKGEFINWFDSDDLMLPFFLNDCKTLFRNSTGLDLALTDYDIFRDEDGTVFYRQRNNIQNLRLDYFTGKINFGAPHCLWNKKIVQCSKFDENLSKAQELDFHFQILSKQKLIFAKLENVSVLVRRHKISITSFYNNGSYKELKSELIVRRTILKYLHDNYPEYLTAAMRIYLGGFKKFSYNFSIQESLKELRYFEKALSLKKMRYQKWKVELIFLLLIKKLFNRKHRLKWHFRKLNGEGL